MTIRTICMAAFAAALAGCGGGGGDKTVVGGVVDPADPQALVEAIIVKIGGEVREPQAGAPPPPSTAEDRPLAKIDNGDVTLTPAQTAEFTVSLTPDVQSVMCQIFVKIGGSQSLFAADTGCPQGKALVPGVTLNVPVSIQLPANIGAGRFCVEASGQDDQGRVSNVANYCVNVVAPHTPINQAPVASATQSITAIGGQTVTLDGSGSADADGEIVAYRWQQIDGGPAVALAGAQAAVASFVAPAAGGVLAFTLTVTDDKGDQDRTTVTVSATAGQITPAILDVTPSSPTLAFDATDPAQGVVITALVADADNHPIPGIVVSFTSDTGALTAPVSTTNAAGVATTVLTTGGDATLRTITVNSCVSVTCRFTPVDVVTTAPNPALMFSAVPSTVSVNQPATLMWTSTNATSCLASDAWTGSQALSGSLDVMQATIGVFTYTLTCTGAAGTTPAQISVPLTVTAAQPPIADAGADQSVDGGDVVTLDGSGSSDPGGSPLASYAWTVTSGPAVTLQNANAAVASFTAPAVAQTTPITLQLTVTTSGGISASDDVVITVAAAPLAPPPTLSQVTATVNPLDPGYLFSNALVDVVDGDSVLFAARRDCDFDPNGGCLVNGGLLSYPFDSSVVEQLNTNPPDNPAGSSTQSKLRKILDFARNNADQLKATVARVRVTVPAGVGDFAVSLQRAGAPLDVVFFRADGNSIAEGPITTDAALGNSARWYGFRPAPGKLSFDLLIYGDGDDPTHATLGELSPGVPVTGDFVQPGDVLKVFSRDANGFLGNFATLAVQDHVPPTLTSEAGYVFDLGTHILSLSPMSADVVDLASGPFASNTFADDTLAVSDPAYPPSGGATYLANIGAASSSVVADATSTASFLSGALKDVVLHVGFSEPIALGPGTPSYNGSSAAIGPFSVSNNVLQRDPTAPRINKLNFTVDDLLALQIDANTGQPQLDFAGAVRDGSGNVATSASNVAVGFVDALPPLMTLGFHDGENLVFRFSEPIQKTGHLAFTDSACPALVDLTAGAVTLDGTGTLLTVPANEFLAQNPTADLSLDCLGAGGAPAGLPAYAESAYSAASLGSLTVLPAAAIAAVPSHGGVSYFDVPDLAGNTWADWRTLNKGPKDPYFAVANIVPVFEPVAVIADASYTTGSGQGQAFDLITFTITFSGPIDLSLGCNSEDDFNDIADGDCDGAVSATEAGSWAIQKVEYFDSTANGPLIPEVADLLDSMGASVLDVANPEAVSIVVQFVLQNPVAANDAFRIRSGSGFTSFYDGSQNVFAFDEGEGGEINSDLSQFPGDGENGRNELIPLLPDTPLTCPQVTRPDGGANEC